jgi:tRNA G18 (ribose-2'-O)-methylase SpoU
MELDTRNVQDRFKHWTTDLIKETVKKESLPFSVLMQQLESDFNIGSVFRSANGFGASEVYYYGKKRYDRRGQVGVNNYFDIKFLKTLDDVSSLKEKYKFVALELTENAVDLRSFVWPNNSLMIIGEESLGVSKELLDMSDYVVKIPLMGSVRSYNAACASSIAMYDFVSKYKR